MPPVGFQRGAGEPVGDERVVPPVGQQLAVLTRLGRLGVHAPHHKADRVVVAGERAGSVVSATCATPSLGAHCAAGISVHASSSMPAIAACNRGLSPHRDREPHIPAAARVDHRAGVEPGVRADSDRAVGAGRTHAPDRFDGEPLGAASVVGGSFPRPGRHDLVVAVDYRDQRMVAAGTVAVDPSSRPACRTSGRTSSPRSITTGSSRPGRHGPVMRRRGCRRRRRLAGGHDPHVNTRSHVPIVEGARTSWPNTISLPPARSTSMSSMYSAPASSAEITVMALIPQLAPPTRPDRSVDHPGDVESLRQRARQHQPGVGDQMGSSKVADRRSGLCDAVTLNVPS